MLTYDDRVCYVGTYETEPWIEIRIVRFKSITAYKKYLRAYPVVVDIDSLLQKKHSESIVHS